MEKSVVEWLVDKLFDPPTLLQEQLQWIEKAKEMEKEQIRTIVLAYQEERNGQSDGAQNKWEPYEVDEFLENYNETFNTDEK